VDCACNRFFFILARLVPIRRYRLRWVPSEANVVGGTAGRGRGRPMQAISSVLRLARVVLFTLRDSSC
jgi:hypothetical protein